MDALAASPDVDVEAAVGLMNVFFALVSPLLILGGILAVDDDEPTTSAP